MQEQQLLEGPSKTVKAWLAENVRLQFRYFIAVAERRGWQSGQPLDRRRLLERISGHVKISVVPESPHNQHDLQEGRL